MDALVAIPLAVATIYLVAYALYYSVYAIVGLLPSTREPASQRRRDHVLLVPAHNEARTIGGILRSLRGLEYPAERVRIVVLADHCDDDTARVAAEAGATVLDRREGERGKGAALAWAFEQLLADRGWDAVSVFDADNRVDRRFLHAVDALLDRGAEAVQGYIDTKNPGESLLAGVSAIAYWSANRLFQAPRSRLGFGAVLGGTGLTLARRLLVRVPFEATALTEDLEYQARLTLAGARVAYAAEARVYDEKPASAATSMRQRLRWMQGYWDVLTRYLPRLLWDAFAHGAVRSLEMAAYCAAPPRSLLSAGLFAMGVLALVLPAEWRWLPVPPVMWFIAWLVFSLLPLLAMPLERAPARAYRSVPLIPLFAVSWAPLVVLGLVRRGGRAWSSTPHAADEGE